jgi:hypothetical protein
MPHVAQATRGHKLGRADREALEVPAIRHEDLAPPALRLGHQRSRVGRGGRHGLVHEHMRARPERRHRIPEMRRVRRGDHDALGALRRQHRSHIRVAGHPEGRGHAVELLPIGPRDRDDLGPGVIEEGWDVDLAAPPPRADHGDARALRHPSPP